MTVLYTYIRIDTLEEVSSEYVHTGKHGYRYIRIYRNKLLTRSDPYDYAVDRVQVFQDVPRTASDGDRCRLYNFGGIQLFEYVRGRWHYIGSLT